MYVIYRENNLPGIGGVHPKGINVGLGYYKGWNLANCPENKMHDYKEFDFISVPMDVVKGLQILDRLVLEDVELASFGAPEGSKIDLTLSAEDELNIEAAKKFINNIELKVVVRAKVRELKDLEDDLVDLKRFIQSLITFSIDDWNNKPDVEKEKSKYKMVMNDLTITVAENTGILSTIEKDLHKLETLVDMEVEIATIVDNYYLTKKL